MTQILILAQFKGSSISESLEEAAESRPDRKVGIGGRYDDERRRCGTRARHPPFNFEIGKEGNWLALP
jgi:hypothetical protein